MSRTPPVGIDKAAGVWTLTLGHGPAHPLSRGMIGAIQEALDAAAGDRDARVLLIEAPGHIFCAGHDLKEIAAHRRDNDQGRAYVTDLFDACATMMQTIVSHPLPVIAIVDGIATAGGLQLVASCDLAFATPRARFALPGVQNGGFCTTPSVAVGRVIGRRHLMEMALSGQPFDAEWAKAAGLVNDVGPMDVIRPRVDALVQAICGGHGPAIAAGKRMFYDQVEMPLAQAYAAATEVMIGHFMDGERISRDTENWG